MKLAGLAATRYFARPEPERTGLLIFGADAMRVALRRQEVIAALIGPEGEAEMRLSRIPAADLRRDGAVLLDVVKAVGFFPGPRVAFLEDATDALAPAVEAAVAAWRPGDAQIVVTAGSLTAKSPLRKVFEGHSNAYAIGIYDDPPSREEIEEVLKKAGLRDISQGAMTDLLALAKTHPAIEKVIDYRVGGTGSITEAFSCDAMLVTADSMSMITEGVAARRPVAVLEPAGLRPSRDTATVADLERQGRLARIPLAGVRAAQDLLTALSACRPMTENHLERLADLLEPVLPARTEEKR